MAEETVVTEEVQTETTETQEVDVNQLAKQVDELKKLQAGSDRAYQEAAKRLKEIEAENEKLKKEKMSEDEKLTFELQKQRKELEEKDREVKTERANFLKMKVINEYNLPADAEGFIKGETEADIRASAEKFQAVLSGVSQAKVDEALGTISTPAAGSEENPTAPNFKNMSLRDIEKLAKEGNLKL